MNEEFGSKRETVRQPSAAHCVSRRCALGLVSVMGFAMWSCEKPRPSVVERAERTDPITRPRSPTPWHARLDRGKWVAPTQYVVSEAGPDRFGLAGQGTAAPLVVSSGDFRGVVRAAEDLRTDMKRVVGTEPILALDNIPSSSPDVVLIGTLGRSPIIDRVVASGKLDVSGVAGHWETFLLQVVKQPLPGVGRALIIAGSDQRGTIYGIYDLCSQMGVSPWHFWDDVPPQQRSAIHVLPGRHTQGEPAVKYRGIFINDENPALGTWAPKFFGPGLDLKFPGGFNRRFYEKVFETMLRLKANYLWPAVWGRAFAEDDPQNQATADAYGIVMGTSHEAPMNRGIEEWNRHAVAAVRDGNGNLVKPGTDPYGGTGEWSFRRNGEAVKAYWKQGIERIGDSEVVVTLGMRGNGDTSLEDGAGIDLMESIVGTERQLLTEVLKKDVRTIPQVWTLYKEVQDYWDRGMRAPEDVTIIWCDDNWGNMRKLPSAHAPKRAGGYGLYYHFDYVGGSRNYKWVDTNSLPNIWEQLHLAYRYGVEQLWVVNVGDLKNEELPVQFFLDYAWNPERWPIARLGEWEQRWAAQQFGPAHARAIAEVLHRYARMQSRRKPELLNRKILLDPNKDLASNPQEAVVYDDAASPYSLSNYGELERVVEEWKGLADEAERLKRLLPERYQDAYYQLVYYEVKASALLYELRLAEFTNLHYFAQGRAGTNAMAARAEELFRRSADLATFYNRDLAGGKWSGFQTQPYIGYGDVERYGKDASWQQPEKDNRVLPDEIFPPVKHFAPKPGKLLGVAIDGSEKSWPGEPTGARLPSFSPYQRQSAQYVEVFSRGTAANEFRITTGTSYLKASPNAGRVGGKFAQQVRVTLSVDWPRAPKGTSLVPITITSPDGMRVTMDAIIENPEVNPGSLRGFVESNGYLSIEADHFTNAVSTSPIEWQRLADIGRTGSGMTPFPVTATSQVPGGNSPRLEYELHLFTSGPIEIWAYHSPRNNVLPGDGIRYAISLDDEPPQIVNMTAATGAIPMNRSWERNTADNVTRTMTRHTMGSAGRHVLKYWMVDPTVILQNLVVDTGGLKPSYLGPPESYFAGTLPEH